MNVTLLQKTMLFRDMSPEEIDKALSAMKAQEKDYSKGETIMFSGSTTQRMGMVVDGSVTIESNDMWGNRSILSHVGKGQFFAETYALLEDEPLLVDVTANEDCRVLFLRVDRLKQSDSLTEFWTIKYLANLLTIAAHKNLTLSGRSFHTAPKTARGRIMAYLNSISLQKQSREFEIPFDRQQMADYLNLDRTALSKELGRMKKDGLITVRKNHFRIIRTQD